MELVLPGLGLIFWMTLAFGIVLFVLRKFAWRPILGTIREREQYIVNSLRDAKKIQREMAELDSIKQKMILQANVQQNEILAQAKQQAEFILRQAKEKARDEASQIMEDARRNMLSERRAMEYDIKKQIAALAVDMAEKVLQEEFTDSVKYNRHVSQLLERLNLN